MPAICLQAGDCGACSPCRNESSVIATMQPETSLCSLALNSPKHRCEDTAVNVCTEKDWIFHSSRLCCIAADVPNRPCFAQCRSWHETFTLWHLGDSSGRVSIAKGNSAPRHDFSFNEVTSSSTTSWFAFYFALNFGFCMLCIHWLANENTSCRGILLKPRTAEGPMPLLPFLDFVNWVCFISKTCPKASHHITHINTHCACHDDSIPLWSILEPFNNP